MIKEKEARVPSRAISADALEGTPNSEDAQGAQDIQDRDSASKGDGKSERRGRPAKPVLCVETETVYGCVAEAAQAVSRHPNSVYAAIGKKGLCGGFHWRYAAAAQAKKAQDKKPLLSDGKLKTSPKEEAKTSPASEEASERDALPAADGAEKIASAQEQDIHRPVSADAEEAPSRTKSAAEEKDAKETEEAMGAKEKGSDQTGFDGPRHLDNFLSYLYRCDKRQRWTSEATWKNAEIFPNGAVWPFDQSYEERTRYKFEKHWGIARLAGAASTEEIDSDRFDRVLIPLEEDDDARSIAIDAYARAAATGRWTVDAVVSHLDENKMGPHLHVIGHVNAGLSYGDGETLEDAIAENATDADKRNDSDNADANVDAAKRGE